MPRVLVIGSSNTDLIIRASKLPSPGETVLGGTFFADKLLKKGAQNAIITLGAQGAFLATPNQTLHIPAFKTTSIDTTGAGDAFNGALSCALSENQSLETAIRFACAAGALTVGKAGAQPAIPTRDQIDALLANLP